MASKKELKALITLAGRIDPSLQTALMRASAQTDQLGQKSSKVGPLASKGLGMMKTAATAAGAAVVAGAVAGTVALGGMLMEASSTADNLLKLRDKTGMTAEELQRLQYMSDQLGANFESMPQAVSILTKQMDAARSGSKDTAAAFKDLGIKITDGTGKLRPQSQVFQEAIMQLSKIENESERNAMAFKLFGRGAAELFPLLNAGTGELEKLSLEADKFGLVMSEGTVEALDEFGDTMDKLKATGRGFGNEIAGQLLPKVMPFLDNLVEKAPMAGQKVMEFAGKFAPLGSSLGKLFQTVAPLAGQLLPILAGIAVIIGNGLAGAIEFVLPIVQKLVDIISWVLDKIGKIPSGVKGLISNVQNNAAENPYLYSGMAMYANGGIAKEPSIFGDGPEEEMAIPLKRTPRSLGLLNQTAKILGVGGNSANVTVNVYASGGQPQQIASATKEAVREVLEEIFGDKERVSFA